MLRVREATEADVDAIRDIFLASYGETYAHPQFYDPVELKRMIYGDDTLLLVAEETESGRVVGTASVVLQVGAYADLVGEFGRLAVHPDARGKGCGRLLMQERVGRVEPRLHLGLVENRVAHSFSQRISASQGFVPLGFVPLKLLFDRRESVALYGRHFGDALSLRRNHPRIVPEVYKLAHLSLGNCHIPPDVIVEADVSPYPHANNFDLEQLTTEGYTRLLRIERGRVKNREVFGPIRLHYGLFLLRARRSNYLIARQNGHTVGGLGYLVDEVEKAVRVIEVVSTDEEPIYFLFRQLIDRCINELDVAIIEVDVSAYSPRIQRTLVELEFLPTAYIPAMVFHDVERLDAVKMARLLVPYEEPQRALFEPTQPFADVVTRSLSVLHVQPRIASEMPRMPLFRDLSREQAQRLAATCELATFSAGEVLFHEGDSADRIYIMLRGDVEITVGRPPQTVGQIGPGECLGEMSLVRESRRSATAVARSSVEAAVLAHADLKELVRLRPDIGVVIYRNLAQGLGDKLERTDRRLLP